MERTLILVKPDAFARGLTGEIVARFERKGLTIVAMRHMQVTEDLAKQHYAEHDGKPFFGELVEFITSGPIVAMVLEGQDAVKAARQVIGATNPLEAAPGSIRGDFAIEVGTNMVHGSDSPESGERTTVARTAVTFRELDDALMDWYVATGEWRGRAGGYAIQGRGAALVRGIRGDYLNVVGLPVATLLDLLL